MRPDTKLISLKTAKPIDITVLPPLPASSCSCGGGCSSGPDPTQVLLQRLEELKRSYSNPFLVEVMQYTTEAQLQSAIEKLNLALKASESDYVVSETNLKDVLSSAAPILIINNELVSSGTIPKKDSLLKFFEKFA